MSTMSRMPRIVHFGIERKRCRVGSKIVVICRTDTLFEGKVVADSATISASGVLATVVVEDVAAPSLNA
jgi:hypothetical protein